MAEKYQDILSFLDQSSSSSYPESDERVTTRSLTTVTVLIKFLHALGINGTILLHHLNPGKGFSRRHDASV